MVPEYNILEIAAANVCLMRDDLPEPDTPVTHMSLANGISQISFLRLLPDAPFNIIFLPFPNRRFLLYLICFLLDKYCPVMDCLFFLTLSGCPKATISPPLMPAFGPISMSQSARFIVSSSCSTTITVFPISLKFSNVEISFSLSR